MKRSRWTKTLVGVAILLLFLYGPVELTCYITKYEAFYGISLAIEKVFIWVTFVIGAGAVYWLTSR